MSETTPLVPPRFLYRFSVPCHRAPLAHAGDAARWADEGSGLDERYRLPSFELIDGRQPWADVRVAWCPLGIAVALRVEGKRHAPRTIEDQPWTSDGLQCWIDTRNTQNVHRATRFCHQFLALPSGGGRRRTEPLIEQFFIHRAKENARRAVAGELWVRSEARVNGYLLEVFLRSVALTGYDPDEHPKLGFTYAVVDHELGEQTFGCPGGLPFREDPSVWSTLELVE